MNKRVSVLTFASMMAALTSCQTVFHGDYKSIHRGLDTCSEEVCSNLDKNFEMIVSRYDEQGLPKERDSLTKSQRTWLEYRQKDCKLSSNGEVGTGAWSACYKRLTEERARYFYRQEYLLEFGLPYCTGASYGYPKDSDLDQRVLYYPSAVTRSHCELKCKEGEMALAKKYPEAVAYCQFGGETILWQNVEHPEQLPLIPYISKMGFSVPEDTE